MPVDKILMQVKDDPNLKWPKPLSSSSKKWDLKKYCHFRKDHGHYTNKCHDLKEHIEELKSWSKKDRQSQSRSEDKSHDNHKDDLQDHLKQVVGEIKMITGGPITGGSYKSLKRAYNRQINSIHIKHHSVKYRCPSEDDFVFFWMWCQGGQTATRWSTCYYVDNKRIQH